MSFMAYVTLVGKLRWLLWPIDAIPSILNLNLVAVQWKLWPLGMYFRCTARKMVCVGRQPNN
jgi:hypothetical protein